MCSHLYEIRKHVLPTPAWISKVLPCIVLYAGSTSDDESVDDTSTSNNMPLVIATYFTVQEFLRFCREVHAIPINAAMADESRDGDFLLRVVPELVRPSLFETADLQVTRLEYENSHCSLG